MDQLTIQNFRCFQEQQTIRLAPLTLLVGENSTGKTSLMAMVQILWNTVFVENPTPNFNEAPFALGSYREIVSQSGENGSIQEFSGGFSVGDYKSDATFRKANVAPEVSRLHVEDESASLLLMLTDGRIKIEAKTSRGKWKFDFGKSDEYSTELEQIRKINISGPISFLAHLEANQHLAKGDTSFTRQDMSDLVILGTKPYTILRKKFGRDLNFFVDIISSSPVRAKPLRTYEPNEFQFDPEGTNLPALFARLENSDEEQWKLLKQTMESFGKLTGVFDEIRIRSLGKDNSSDPFQIQIRNNTKRNKGEWRNLIDVGYGVSQILPVLFMLTRSVDSPMFLLQQPELHLHPSAQAGLGSILCDVASKRQILVETHSDYLIDRVRMDVRDKKCDLKPEDISILYFERCDDDVQIHNIHIDENGNIEGQPPSYREFFRKEVNRLLEF